MSRPAFHGRDICHATAAYYDGLGKGRHPIVAKNQQEVSMDVVVGQGGHTYRVDENWPLAICFHEAPEGTQIKLIEKI